MTVRQYRRLPRIAQNKYAGLGLETPEAGVETYDNTIGRPDMRMKHCAYGQSDATLLNPRGVTTVFHK
jgi:hypothetical protein